MWLKNCLDSFLVSGFHGTLPYFLSASFTLPKLSARSGMKAMKTGVLEWGGGDTSRVSVVTACSGKWCFGGDLCARKQPWKVWGKCNQHGVPEQWCFGCILTEREANSCVLMEKEAAFSLGGWGGAGSCTSTASPLTEASPQRPCPSATRRGSLEPDPQKNPKGGSPKTPYSAHACLEHPRAPLRPALELQFRGAPLKPPLRRRHPPEAARARWRRECCCGGAWREPAPGLASRPAAAWPSGEPRRGTGGAPRRARKAVMGG